MKNGIAASKGYAIGKVFIQQHEEIVITDEKVTDVAAAKEELNKQIEAFGNCNIKEYKTFYNLLKNWNKEIINSFIIVDGRRINNSHIESINRQKDRLMYNANGYINFKRARNRIMYCINKKDTYKM